KKPSTNFLTDADYVRTSSLHTLTQQIILACEYRATILYSFTDALDHSFSVGLHQSNPGRRSCRLRIVASAPVSQISQYRDKIQAFFSQDILFFALIRRRGLFHKNTLLLQ